MRLDMCIYLQEIYEKRANLNYKRKENCLQFHIAMYIYIPLNIAEKGNTRFYLSRVIFTSLNLLMFCYKFIRIPFPFTFY